MLNSSRWYILKRKNLPAQKKSEKRNQINIREICLKIKRVKGLLEYLLWIQLCFMERKSEKKKGSECCRTNSSGCYAQPAPVNPKIVGKLLDDGWSIKDFRRFHWTLTTAHQSVSLLLPLPLGKTMKTFSVIKELIGRHLLAHIVPLGPCWALLLGTNKCRNRATVQPHISSLSMTLSMYISWLQ